MLHNKGQYSISIILTDLARSCHLRLDDVIFTLTELGFLRHRRRSGVNTLENGSESTHEEAAGSSDISEVDQWKDVEIIVSRDAVMREWEKWRVRPKGVLDETCVLL